MATRVERSMHYNIHHLLTSWRESRLLRSFIFTEFTFTLRPSLVPILLSYIVQGRHHFIESRLDFINAHTHDWLPDARTLQCPLQKRGIRYGRPPRSFLQFFKLNGVLEIIHIYIFQGIMILMNGMIHPGSNLHLIAKCIYPEE